MTMIPTSAADLGEPAPTVSFRTVLFSVVVLWST